MRDGQWIVTIARHGEAPARVVGPFTRKQDTAPWIEANRCVDWAGVDVGPLEDPGYQYTAATRKVYVHGPYIKDEHSYFSPGAWSDPTAPYGYMLGGIAYYYVLRNRYTGAKEGLRAAATPERAREAVMEYLAEEIYLEPTWLSAEESRALKDDSWRCPGCARSAEEVPGGHEWRRGSDACTWTSRYTRTRWWPDGTVRDEYWSPDAAADA